VVAREDQPVCACVFVKITRYFKARTRARHLSDAVSVRTYGNVVNNASKYSEFRRFERLVKKVR